MRTRVKFCGITSASAASLACDIGADAVGLVFVASSLRALTLEAARPIVASLSCFVSSVGLFVNPQRAVVEEALKQLDLSYLQFHGEETEDFCASFDTPYIKAVRVRSGKDVMAASLNYRSAAALLVDSHNDSGHGGTGTSFDWSLLPSIDLPLILAGGLNADLVGAAIRQVSPYALDVSSGIESAPGIKDAGRMRDFIRQVRIADEIQTN